MAKRKSAQRHYLIGNGLDPDTRQASTARLGAYSIPHPRSTSSRSTSSTLTPMPSSDVLGLGVAGDAVNAVVADAALQLLAGGATSSHSRVAAKRRRRTNGQAGQGPRRFSRHPSDDLLHQDDDGHDDGASSSPSSSLSLRSLATTHTLKSSHVQSLAHLPADILLRIADLLQPILSPFRADGDTDGLTVSGDGDGGPSLSSQWIDPGTDVINLRSTCRAIYLAIEPLRGTVSGVRLQQGEHPGGVRVLTNFPLGKRAIDPSGDGSELVIARTRHLWIHSTLPRNATDSSIFAASTICGLIEGMPRLRTFALVQATEDEVVFGSPYTALPLHRKIFSSLSRLERLHSLYLCGVKLQARAPVFPHVTTLVLNACHDCPLELISTCPKLEIVKAWRDFALRAQLEMAGKWWPEQRWMTVKHAELRGFSGVTGSVFRLSWLRNLMTLRALPTPPVIPLISLRLCEAYDYTDLCHLILPAIAHLPHLTSFTCMVWKDRNFGPTLLGKIAGDLPNLVHLGLLLENEGTNWWPGDMVSVLITLFSFSQGNYGHELMRFKKLETFTWNFTAYVGLDWAATRETSLFVIQSLLCHVGPKFKRLHWLQQSEYVLRSSITSKWVWSDDVIERSLLEEEGGILDDVDGVGQGRDGKENRVDDGTVGAGVPKRKRGIGGTARKKLFDVASKGVVGGGGGRKRAPSRWALGIDWEQQEEGSLDAEPDS
ncbi:BZ3500_MvSof-1268-A1-R1_Chr1-3g01719 [Microbotryum saponariae]|uniref:BZ3500_MvSof-1268-A1-R1_Chr1-3g01719 protein n=1 Tax=Microbotryum saponariae TaxID=289078 RepID=A0A2X0KCE1_9BASI|nr:BZ3500_MvSof-1268-A1-R1_Chr1-3g01719 [Microbotryum saponariae]SCZ94422.1 BZ3501_MvSof-1269-A2-R1_Chr1-3g01320 [Microbotryum saponariae]